MRTRYKFIDAPAPYFLTHTIVAWIPVFTRKPYFDLVLEALAYCRQHKGLKIFAYVILDNHMHLLAAGERLPAIIKGLKSLTARQIIDLAQRTGREWLLSQFAFHKQRHKSQSIYQVWQEGAHPQMITSEVMLRQKIDYIHYNPVKVGLVDRPEDWPYSSARDYLGLKGLLEIDPLEV